MPGSSTAGAQIKAEPTFASQKRRRLVYDAQSKGKHQVWDFQPIRDAGTSYMRNHLVLDDLEERSRLRT